MIGREILHAVVDVAHQLRERDQVARVLTVGIAFAGGSSVSRSRTLREPSAYTDDLRIAALELFERMGLQRARVRGISVRAEQLSGAEGGLGAAEPRPGARGRTPPGPRCRPSDRPFRPWRSHLGAARSPPSQRLTPRERRARRPAQRSRRAPGHPGPPDPPARPNPRASRRTRPALSARRPSLAADH
ncbi:hypothetical protein [Actinacidiphila sp. bgisy160]|uniref:DinB/UmuC family translesion DNA polymerase n=1 Tax=Actinacidiphila sp. bgisy160 TaxID=3413796 RepID=UPI003D735CB4